MATRTHTLLPYTSLFRSPDSGETDPYRRRERHDGYHSASTAADHSAMSEQSTPQQGSAAHGIPWQQLPDAAVTAATVAGALTAFWLPLPIYSLWQRSEEHTSELQSLMRISYAVFCLNKKTTSS